MGLIETIKERPQDILLPNAGLNTNALENVKKSFDPIVKGYSIFDQMHVEGLDAEQVWAQAQMVVDGVVDKLLSDEIPVLQAGKKRVAKEMSSDEEEDEEEEDVSMEGVVGEGESDSDNYNDPDDSLRVNVDEDEEGGVEGLEKDESEEEGDDNDDEDEKKNQPPGAALNDRFFNIDEFNQQVLALEQEDYDFDDDDEEIDYFKDMQGEEGEEEAKYKDFFDPPTKQKKKNKRVKIQEPEEEFQGLDIEDEYGNVEHAMENARKELFESDDDEADNDDGQEQSNERLSTFEKQQQDIMKQIQDLENENVAQKHWTVRGEIKKSDRPQESLIYEDLDFERSSKPVPVITQEVTESLEDTIKRRIRLEQFDDIPKRLPTATPQFKKSRDADVQETKSQKSLAELYEDDYRKEHDPTYTDAKNDQLDGSHHEIIDLYNSIAHKLDSLCSFNYTPKAPKPTISIKSNAASISMEDAQPSTQSSTSMLAPQEVYTPSTDDKREVVGRNNMPVAKAEMTREQRKRQRKRDKAKHAKQQATKHEKQRALAEKSGSKADVMSTLKKENVTIIDKKGEKRSVDGKVQKDKRASTSAGFKL